MTNASSSITVIEPSADMVTWRDLVARSDAPVFYRPEFLAAYRSYPLRPIHDSRHLLLVDARRHALAALPVYLVDLIDPFQTIANQAMPLGASPRRMVVSHFWHCYDTRLLALDLSGPVVEAAMETLQWHATEWKASGYGFINVARRGPLGERLRALGLDVVPARDRYRVTLDGVRSVEEYLAHLSAHVRHEVRRNERRAAEAGVTVQVHVPPIDAGLLDRTAELCKYTADRHNPGYYPPSLFAPFLASVGSSLRIIAIVRANRTITVGICFKDGRTFHGWALGVDPEEEGRYSPFLVLLMATIETALAEGCAQIELGRTNDEWKQRHGARRVEMASWLRMTEW